MVDAANIAGDPEASNTSAAPAGATETGSSGDGCEVSRRVRAWTTRRATKHSDKDGFTTLCSAQRAVAEKIGTPASHENLINSWAGSPAF